MSEKIWSKLIRQIQKAGGEAIPYHPTLVEILQTLITEEQAKFLHVFRKPKLTMDQIKQKTDLDEKELEKKLKDLIYKGFITALPNESTGIMEYNLNPFIGTYAGIFERTFYRGGTSEKDKKIAYLYEKLFNDLKQVVQKNYDQFVSEFKNQKPGTRIVPVEEHVDLKQQTVLPLEEVTKIVEKYDVYGVGTCYCRHKQELVGNPCKMDAPGGDCLLLGKHGKFLIEHDFAKPISKDEALRMLKEAEENGFVHTTFHDMDDPEYNEFSICSCCKCCCGTLELYHRGLAPINTLTSYLANVDSGICIGCGTCVEKCPMEAIDLVDTIAVVNEEKCIGCGVCVHHCPEEAMNLNRTGLRTVFIPPPRQVEGQP